MTEHLYVVTGASGNVGKIVAERLLARGKRVRVIGREASRLEAHAMQGAEVRVGSLEDAGFLTKAFEGATAVFAMIPPNVLASDVRAYQNRITEAIATGAEKAGLKYMVTLSSVGADRPEGGGPVNGSYDMEQRLNRIPNLSVLHLRPGYFMDNLLISIGMIKSMNINGSAMLPDVAIPVIAARDIGEVAARRLAALDFQGSSFLDLRGPRDLTQAEMTRVAGAAIGKPDLTYVAFPYEDAYKGMVGMGMSADMARLFIELNKGFNDGSVKPTQPRSAETTGPTTIEEFVRTVFAPAYHAS
jgi:uncharacterized protein YbjT (DUF2867 family)